ncbi:MAG TPA: DUF1559 domain-containing protein [Gemmataceae bacterium]|nr:DUF1559 domain-containing protein [Gemmataceae bacterium]
MDKLLPPFISRALPEAFGPLIIVATTAFLGIAIGRWLYRYLHDPEHGTSRLPLIAIQAPVGLFVLLSLVPAISYVAGFLAQKNTEGNMKKIATAMTHGYAADHDRRLPPQAIRDIDGRPLLSWRVAILPYLGHEDFYRQFHLDEAWDSPHNIQLLKKMPGEYEGNFLVRTPRGFTHFQVFTGENTAFERDGLRVDRDFDPQPYHTFLVVEASDPVPWTKPEDISYCYPIPILPRLGENKPKGLLALYPSKGFFAATVDGLVCGRLDLTYRQMIDGVEREHGCMISSDW